ncbi:MAG: CDP-diacylglycerol--serine O-phosphatidyltransferase [Cytophagales bacterium]|nr:CDP-diacylglycerol--serine O-phosphatidyltransferase [Cytophagales bacterium]
MIGEIKKHIPNAITSGNLLCGCIGIVLCFEGELELAAYLMGLAMVFDFADGFVARLLGVSSPIGKELDSLADMVTFGILPSIIMFHLMEGVTCNSKTCTGIVPSPYYPYLAFIIAIFSALRLAKFNVDTRQSDSFIGVPTPANAFLIGSLPFLIKDFPFIAHPKILFAIAAIMSFLLVAELPLIALKFKNYSFKDNAFRYILIASSILFLVFFQYAGIPLIIITYILLSVVHNMINK